jgi:hypothetical protein
VRTGIVQSNISRGAFYLESEFPAERVYVLAPLAFDLGLCSVQK